MRIMFSENLKQLHSIKIVGIKGVPGVPASLLLRKSHAFARHLRWFILR